MQIHITDIAPLHPLVQREMYTTLELLRLAVRKIDLAKETIDAHEGVPAALRKCLLPTDDGGCDVDCAHLNDIEAVCTVLIAIMQEICTAAAPALPDRVFADLMAYPGDEYDPPHLGGLAMILVLAARHMGQALTLSAEHDGSEIDDAYRVMKIVKLSIESEYSCLESSIRSPAEDKDIDAILRGEPVTV